MMAGVEIQATAFLNLWRGDWLTKLPTWLEAMVLILSGMLLGVAAFLRPEFALASSVLGFLCLVMAWYLVWAVYLIWFPGLIVVGGQMPILLWANRRYHRKARIR